LLVYESTEQLLAETESRRYLHTVLLTALRDKAERVEVRFGGEGGMLYYRVDGRDWNCCRRRMRFTPYSRIRCVEAARLVRPERPDLT